MLKKAFSVKLHPDTANDQNSEVVQWFSRMDKESIPASIECAEDGSRKVEVVNLTSSPILSSEDDATLILEIAFQRYKMRNAGDGAFYNKSSIEALVDFKSYFVVEEVK